MKCPGSVVGKRGKGGREKKKGLPAACDDNLALVRSGPSGLGFVTEEKKKKKRIYGKDQPLPCAAPGGGA